MAIERIDKQFQYLEREAGRPEILGVFRKGAPKSGNAPGADLKHFRFQSESKELVEEIEAIFGKEPTMVTGVIPFAEIDNFWSYWQEKWTKTTFWHRCNGIRCVRWRDEKTDKVISDTDLPPGQQAPACPGGCVPVGRLSLIVPELFEAATVGILTTSINDIAELKRNILYIQDEWGKGPNGLKGVEVAVKRRPKAISVPTGEKGKRIKKVSWLLSVGVTREFIIAQLDRVRSQALTEGQGVRLALPAAIDIDEFEDVTDEQEAQIGATVPESDVKPEPEAKPEPPAEKRPKAASAKGALQNDIDRAKSDAKHIVAIGGVTFDAKTKAYTVKEDSGHAWRVSGQNGSVVCERLWEDEGDGGDYSPTVCERLAKGRNDDPKFHCAHIIAAKDYKEHRDADKKAAQEAGAGV